MKLKSTNKEQQTQAEIKQKEKVLRNGQEAALEPKKGIQNEVVGELRMCA